MKKIKRYSNRRLYDPDSSKTITLEDIAAIIAAGEDIEVIDSPTGKDITQSILAQTFIKVSVGQKSPEFARFMLTELIRESSASPGILFARLIQGGIGTLNLTKEKADNILRNLVAVGELTIKEMKSFQKDFLGDLNVSSGENKLQLQKDLDKINKNMIIEKQRKLEELSDKIKEVSDMIRDIT